MKPFLRHFLTLQTWHIVALFAGLGGSVVLMIWAIFNLFSFAIANFWLIKVKGIVGLANGGLVPFIEICLYGIAALLLFLLFKGCQVEIIARWRRMHPSEGTHDETEEM
jgi:hypothetical protein